MSEPAFPIVLARLPSLRGERVLLRAWCADDLAPFAALNADADVMRYFPQILTREESDAVVARAQAAADARGFGWWALEVPGVAPFIGFCGLAVPAFEAHFTPCVEVGWRLAKAHWGRGYATEAARVALHHGFEHIGLSEVVSFTTTTNLPSRRVMERLGMTHDPRDDFDHPRIPASHPLARHVLYRLTSSQFTRH